MADFHFLYPHAFWFLLLLPPLWFWILRRRKQQSGWHELVDPALAPFVLTGRERWQSLASLLLFSLITALSVLALAGPAWEKKEVPVFRQQQALVIALDLSASMYAQDLSPNRLEQARFKVMDILQKRKGEQTALVVFAGDAFPVSPLTDDIKTIEAQMKNLTPDIMPVQGGALGLAIERSLELLQQASAKTGNILLITDGMTDDAQALKAASLAVTQGVNVSVLGIGSVTGAPIPLANGGFLQDAHGKTVMPKLDVTSLKALAQAGNGVYATAGIGDADVNRLTSAWESKAGEQNLISGGQRQVDTWVNAGVWLVLGILPLVALLFRRGWLLSLSLVVLCLPQAQPVQASIWTDLWATPDQQAQAALQAGQAKQASELFKDPNWKAAASYKAGDFEQAAKLYSADQSVEGLYNYGNALARLNKLPEAIKAYEQVLAQNPKHEDARYNRDLLKKKLEEQQQQQQGSQDQKQNQGQQNQQNQQQSGQNQAAEQQNQQQPSSQAEQQATQAQQEQAKQQQEQQAQAEQQKQQEAEKNEAEQQQAQAEIAPMDPTAAEQQQATEQWLRRIPDDPAGLWRRKFQYQYQQRAHPNQGDAW
ncbi:MAG: VWA domain-containing protein [Thiothrix sp.]|nr:MAG: VWA domain-containing protein [Thiothrix sp.]